MVYQTCRCVCTHGYLTEARFRVVKKGTRGRKKNNGGICCIKRKKVLKRQSLMVTLYVI